MLTARDAVPDRVAGLDAGADDYLPKPFAFDELLARIQRSPRRPPAITGTALSYADVRVDLATQRAERAGQKLDLTAKEYARCSYSSCVTPARCSLALEFTNTSGTSGMMASPTPWRFTSRTCGGSSRNAVPG